MAYLEGRDGTRTYYEVDGSRLKPALLLINSLGTALAMWEPQMEHLRKYFFVIRFDCRGHGRTATTPGPYALEQLGQDALDLLDALDVDRAHVCGLSLGGLVAQWLAIHAPSRLLKLVVCCSAARIGTVEGWEQRIAAVQAAGLTPLIPSILERWYTARFLADENEVVRKTRAMLETTDAEGYVACCAALRDTDLRGSIAAVRASTLIVYGEHDRVAPASDAEYLVKTIAGAKGLELAAAHLANGEAAEPFTKALVEFLGGEGLRQDQNRAHFEHGLRIRKEVLGEEHVARSVARTNDFNTPFQDLMTRYAWGEIWDRPGLPRHTRSLLTLALMVALNREQEFKLHVSAAFRNGVTREEMQEVLLQTAIYCGLPAANNAFHWAEEAMATLEQGRKEGQP